MNPTAEGVAMIETKQKIASKPTTWFRNTVTEAFLGTSGNYAQTQVACRPTLRVGEIPNKTAASQKRPTATSFRSRVAGGVLLLFFSCALAGYAVAKQPTVSPPGRDYALPRRETSADAPKIFEHSQEAGADETFLLVGENLTREIVLWGMSDKTELGQEWKPRIQFCDGRYLAATVPAVS
jgi:hypothetical protein